MVDCSVAYWDARKAGCWGLRWAEDSVAQSVQMKGTHLVAYLERTKVEYSVHHWAVNLVACLVTLMVGWMVASTAVGTVRCSE